MAAENKPEGKRAIRVFIRGGRAPVPGFCRGDVGPRRGGAERYWRVLPVLLPGPEARAQVLKQRLCGAPSTDSRAAGERGCRSVGPSVRRSGRRDGGALPRHAALPPSGALHERDESFTLKEFRCSVRVRARVSVRVCERARVCVSERVFISEHQTDL